MMDSAKSSGNRTVGSKKSPGMGGAVTDAGISNNADADATPGGDCGCRRAAVVVGEVSLINSKSSNRESGSESSENKDNDWPSSSSCP